MTILTAAPPAARGGGGAGALGGFGGDTAGRAATPAAPAGTQIAEMALHTAAWVNRVEEKAAFSATAGLYAMASPQAPAASAIGKANVIDLTSQMRPDGTLNWTPPAGNWSVLRLGYSLIGQTNNPASPEATGLEVDKMNPAYVKAYFENYLDQYKDATGGLMGQKGLKYMITDSWEAGAANWTDNMMAEFSKRRGYDMKPWLPVLVGHVVESPEASDRFLWDFRKTLGEMTVEYHYDQLTELLKQRGMMGRYSESHESGRALIADGMDVKRNAAIPMSAMWVGGMGGARARRAASIRLCRGRARIGLRGSHLRTEPGGGRIADIRQRGVVVVAGNAQADGGRGALARPEPFRDPHLGAPADATTRFPGSALDRSASGSRGMRRGPRTARNRGWRILPAVATCSSKVSSLPISCTTTARIPTSPRCSPVRLRICPKATTSTTRVRMSSSTASR